MGVLGGWAFACGEVPLYNAVNLGVEKNPGPVLDVNREELLLECTGVPHS